MGYSQPRPVSGNWFIRAARHMIEPPTHGTRAQCRVPRKGTVMDKRQKLVEAVTAGRFHRLAADVTRRLRSMDSSLDAVSRSSALESGNVSLTLMPFRSPTRPLSHSAVFCVGRPQKLKNSEHHNSRQKHE